MDMIVGNLLDTRRKEVFLYHTKAGSDKVAMEHI